MRPERKFGRERADALPGFELSAAFRTRSFWMISAAQFFFAAVAAGAGLHLITYLTRSATPRRSQPAWRVSSLVFAAFGKLAMGLFAGPRERKNRSDA